MRITYNGLRSGNSRVAIISYAENEENKAYEIARKFTIATSYKVDTLVYGMLMIEVDDMNDFNNVKEWYKEFKTYTKETSDTTESDTTDSTNETSNNTTESDTNNNTTNTNETTTDNTTKTDTTANINNVLESLGNKQLIQKYVDGINNGLQNDSYKQTRECFCKLVQILPNGYEICFTTKYNVDMTKVDEPIYNHRYKIIRDKTGIMFTIHRYSEVQHKYIPLKPETEITDIIRYIYNRTFDSVCRVFKRE